MSVAVTYGVQTTVAETLVANVPAALAANAVVTHNQFNTSLSLTSSTTPPVTKHAAFNKALVAGTATIDLTALTGTNGATVDLTGLKIQVFRVKATAANANPISLTEGAANGYALAGALWLVALKAGQEVTIYGNDSTPDVAAADKNIDLAGTGTQSLDIEIIAG